MQLRRNSSARARRTAAAAWRSAPMPFEQATAKLLIPDHPIAAPHRFFTRIRAHQEISPQSLTLLGSRRQRQVFVALCQELVRLAQGVRAGTRPAILPRFNLDASRHWVALNVTATTQQVVTALNGRAFVATLPAMPDKAVSAVAMMHVRSKETNHHRREGTRIIEL